MRILMVNFAKAIGGSAFHHADLAAGLLTQGHAVMVLDALGDFTQKQCAALPHIQARKGFRHIQMRHAIKSFKPDIVHAHQSLAARIGNRMKGAVPLVATVHGAYKHRSYGASEGIIRVADHQAAGMTTYGGRAVTIWNWMRSRSPVEDKTSLRERLGVPPGRFLFGFVGRTLKDKGLFDLVEAFQRLPQGQADLVVIGTGKDLGQARAMARQCASIHFLGHRDDAASLMQGFDCFVMPSHAEAFPLVLIEALFAGAPIIATRTLGGTELLQDQQATLVDIGDINALSGAMARQIAAPSRPVHDTRPFERDGQIRKTLDFYKAVLGQQG